MTITVKKTRRHSCALCGKPQPRDRLIYSAHTRSYYCRALDGSCERRADRAAAKRKDRLA